MRLLLQALAALVIVALESGAVAFPFTRPQPGPLALMHQRSAGRDALKHVGECRDSSPHGITEIALERSACYGPCPEYTVTLRLDGTATYLGRKNVKNLGEHVGVIGVTDSHEFDRLATLAEDIGFMGRLAVTYTCGASDSPTVFVSIVRDGKRKTIGHYAPDFNGPVSLWSLEQAIDHAADNVEWN